MTEKQRHKMNRLSDRQLVDLLLANDEDAVEYVFFHRCDSMFERIVNSVYQSQGKKEELVTEFYLYLRDNDWKRLRQFSFRSALDTWLTIVAIRYFNAKESSTQTKTEMLDPLLIKNKGEKSVDDYDIFHEMSRVELYEAIDRLKKPRERLALLGELTGKSVEVIAEELGCTVTAVYNLTKKARKAVKKMMKGKDQ